jgi:hypothetical protein
MGEYKLSGFWAYLRKLENAEFVAYSVISFFVPMLIKHPQVLVGSLVNMVLILSALNLHGKKLIPVIVLPSLGALAGGFLFGDLTIYLIYLIPFIWLGNAALVAIFKYLKLNSSLRLGIGAATKTALLFGVTLLLVSFSIVPQIFLTAMGAMQLVTAMTGGLLAFTVQELKSR